MNQFQYKHHTPNSFPSEVCVAVELKTWSQRPIGIPQSKQKTSIWLCALSTLRRDEYHGHYVGNITPSLGTVQ